MNPVFPALAGACLALAALPALTGELGAVLGAGHSHATRMDALEQGRPRVGLSTDSHKRVLDLCLETLTDPRSLDTPAPRRAAALSHCEAQLASAQARAGGDIGTADPGADGYLWWAAAALAAERGAVAEMFAALEHSRQSAPAEGWIALRRAVLDARFEPLQNAAQRAGQEADLLVLAQTRRGMDYLGPRYLAEPEFRERITFLVEQLPPEAQRFFLRNLRNLSRALP